LFKRFKFAILSVLLAGSALGITQTPAFAAVGGRPAVISPLVCIHHGYDFDGRPSDSDANTDNVPVYDGPYDGCQLLTTTLGPTGFQLWCYVENNYGQTWTYVNFHNNRDGRNWAGWVRDVYIFGGGSFNICK